MIVLPEGMSQEYLQDMILIECSELEVLLPRPSIMKKTVTSWAATRLHAWDRLYQSTVQEYNMIHNYDRYEEWSDTGSGSTGSTGQSTESPNITNTRSTAAYNESTLKDVEAQKTTGSRGISSTQSGTSENESSHEGHMYGNIGITTAAQMLQGERDINAYNVYMAIVQEFKRQFCIIVY